MLEYEIFIVSIINWVICYVIITNQKEPVRLWYSNNTLYYYNNNEPLAHWADGTNML